jgi:unsaturated chondroitin disaccharide hydrolase
VLKTIFSLIDYLEEKEKLVYAMMVEKIDEQIEKNKIRQKDAWYPECAFREATRSLEPVRADCVEIDFDLVFRNEVVEGVIGYCDSKTQVTAYSSFSLILRFNAQGYFEAMDGDHFRAASQISYVRNKTYHVSIRADFSDKTYKIAINDGESRHIVAEKFRFGTYVQDPCDIDKISLVVDNMSSFMVLNHKISARP